MSKTWEYVNFFLLVKANSSSLLKATTLQRQHMKMDSVFSLHSSWACSNTRKWIRGICVYSDVWWEQKLQRNIEPRLDKWWNINYKEAKKKAKKQ